MTTQRGWAKARPRSLLTETDLCRQAEPNGAEPAVMEALESLDEGPYESMAEVMSAYGDADDAGDQANSEDYAEDNDNADDQQ